jgi:hypothetical protein
LEGTHKRDVEEHILKRHGLTADKESLAYKKLNRDYLKVYLRFIEILRNREQGDYSDELGFLDEAQASANTAATDSVSTTEEVPDSGPRLTEVIRHYVQEAEAVGQWTAKSQLEITSSLDLFVRVMGDIPFNTIDRPDVREFKETLLKLPPQYVQDPPLQEQNHQGAPCHGTPQDDGIGHGQQAAGPGEHLL